MVANRHGVPKRQWKKWCPEAQETFNEVFKLNLDQDLIRGKIRGATKIGKGDWRTIAWNTAFLAACEVNLHFKKRKGKPDLRVVRESLNDVAVGVRTWTPARRKAYQRAHRELKKAA